MNSSETRRNPAIKEYMVSYRVDVRNNEFLMDIISTGSKSCFQARFTRTGVQESGGFGSTMLNFFLTDTKNYQVRIKSAPMSEEDRHAVHLIFPYIPVFEDVKLFAGMYRTYNSSFSYADYTRLDETRQRLQRDAGQPADGLWKYFHDKDKPVLFCKWTDSERKNHAVLVGGHFFSSDLNCTQIAAAEDQMSIPAQFTAAPFVEAYPDTLLDRYLESGGCRIFSYLISKATGGLMSLMGNSGLSRLADNLDKYEEINRFATNIEKAFHLDMKVLQALNDSDDDMLYMPEDREMLAQAFEESPDVFDQPVTPLANMWLRYYYMNGQPGRIMGGNLAEMIRYLNKVDEIYRNPFSTVHLYHSYLSYSEEVGVCVYGLYPDNLEHAAEEMMNLYQSKKK